MLETWTPWRRKTITAPDPEPARTLAQRNEDEKLIDLALEKVYPIARYQGNPFSYLYNNPGRIHGIQYFAHWVQKWAAHNRYAAVLRCAYITGYELVPASILNKPKGEGYGERRIMIGTLSFYFVQLNEMGPALLRRFTNYKEQLRKEVKRTGTEIQPEDPRGIINPGTYQEV